MELDLTSWTKHLKEAYLSPFLRPFEAEQRLQENAANRSLLENFLPTDEYAIQIKNLIVNEGEYSDDFDKLEASSRKTKTPKPGNRIPPQEFLELVVLGLEMAKGNSVLLYEIRCILQDSNSNNVPPADESVFYWTRQLPKGDEHIFPHTRSVERINKAPSSTEWANEIKRDYIKHLVGLYKRGDERMSRVTNAPVSRQLNSKEKILNHILKKWGKLVVQ